MSTLPEKCFIYRVTIDNWETNFEIGAVALDSGSAQSYVLASYPSATDIKPIGDCYLVAPPAPSPSLPFDID
jgi:hypothetical protein